jgi:hypothetical protein
MVYNIRKRFVEEGLEAALEKNSGKLHQLPIFSMEKRQSSSPFHAANLPMDDAFGHGRYSQTH